MPRHLVTLHLLIDCEEELTEVDEHLKDSLLDALDGLDGSFEAWIENPEWDEMAMEGEPTEEEEAEGYYQADGDQTEMEIEKYYGWSIGDVSVARVELMTDDERLDSAARRFKNLDNAFAHVNCITGQTSGSL